MNLELTPDAVIAIVVMALSLIFDYFPLLSQKFDALEESKKQLITVLLSIAVGVLGFVGGCRGWFSTGVACTVQDGGTLAYNIILAVAGMYGFHKATKPASKPVG